MSNWMRGAVSLALSVATLAGAQESGTVPLLPMCQRAAGPDVHMVFVGDLMLVDGPGRVLQQGRDPFAAVAAQMNQADVRVGNLESLIATTGQPVGNKLHTFRAPPSVLPVLQRHVDVVTVANNHSGDFGRAAFGEMLVRLERAGLPYVGGGRNLRAAHEPHVFSCKGVKIALLGYNEYFPRTFEAGPDWAGVAWSEDEQVVADIRRARTVHGADIVIPFMHWGQEHEQEADVRQRALARLMVDAGADMVVGSHPHVVQDTEVYRGKPIVYSLGNFIFDGYVEVANRTGWLLNVVLNREGVQHWDIDVVRMDRDGVPHPVGRRLHQALRAPQP
ncbi:MAG: CapA family protein [Aquabacterium sp.]|uniref:CapA family protein n=1 Tax=Aquabacterium sp. TaxID=1872578 RepID=UPI003BD30237